MFVMKVVSGSDYNVYLVESFRDNKGRVKQRRLKKFGRLSNLIKNNPNAYEELREKYKKLKKNKNKFINVPLDEEMQSEEDFFNYGYFFIEAIYQGLGVSKCIGNYAQNKNFKYNLDAILKMLVFARILSPSSKKEAIENQDQFLENFGNKYNDTYRALSVLKHIKNDVQVTMHRAIAKKYGRDLSIVLYDVTNYYFETDKENDIKKYGVSKERRQNPIVQMGLVVDKNKIPIGYELFPGNTYDSKTAIPMMQKLKTKFKIKKAVLVADKGINSSANFTKIIGQGDDYIVSQRVRGMNKEFTSKVLCEDDFFYETATFKVKEFI